MFADQVRAVVRVAQDGNGGLGGFGEGGRVPAAGEGEGAVVGAQAGKEGEDQGLDGAEQGQAAIRARGGRAGPRSAIGGGTLAVGLRGQSSGDK
jgi:hypothetical protein